VVIARKNLFYSSAEGIIFWVAGFTENSSRVDSILNMYDRCTREFTKKFLTTHVTATEIIDLISNVSTGMVTKSRCYLGMRYFWVKAPWKCVPKEAKCLEEGWTMKSWLEN